MEYRKVFDQIPEQFDKYRPRYCTELFEYLIGYAGVGPGKKVLELGPGTGQATEPILKTGCDYNAIELGENFYAKMKEKRDGYDSCSGNGTFRDRTGHGIGRDKEPVGRRPA